MTHIVALSGGKDSVALALRLAEVEPRDYTYLCTPTGDELPEMIEHWQRIGERLGRPILSISGGRTLQGLIYAQRALPNWRMRWCTRLLKIEPFQAYILDHLPCTVYVGIRADEADREGIDYGGQDGVTRRYPLVEWGWRIADVLHYLECQGITIPERTDCGACFFQTLWEWYVLWRDHPDRFARYEAWEAFAGHTLRSEQRDSWPAALTGLRARFEAGDIPKQRRVMKDRTAMCGTCAR